MTCWGILYLEGRLLGHILELCRTRRKRLYVLQEINPRWLQMKRCFFMKKLGLRSNSWGKNPFCIVKVQSLKNVWKKEDQCTSIFHFADRPEVPYEVDFRRKIFSKNRFSENVTCFILFEGDFGRFQRDFFICVISLAWNRDGKWWEGVN